MFGGGIKGLSVVIANVMIDDPSNSLRKVMILVKNLSDVVLQYQHISMALYC